MFDFLVNMESSFYVQLVIFLVLIIYNIHLARQLPHPLSLGFEIFKSIILIVIFIYFTLSWSTVVNPSLRTASVVGMFIINLFLIWHVIQNRADRPYQLALNACINKPKDINNYKTLVSKGKHLYYLRYFWRSLFSGRLPGKFLHELASEQIRSDIQGALKDKGLTQHLVNFKMETAFLRHKLAADATLPPDFKEIMEKAISQFEQHPWVEQQVNEFLEIIVASPEQLFTSEWASPPDA
jgi:hypothetical protein